MNKSNKDKIVALILCIFLGTLGVHRFYVGKNKSGILYLCTLGLFGIGWIYDIFNIANNLFTDSYGAVLTSENANQDILYENKKKPAHMMWQFWVAVVVLYVFAFAKPSNTNTEPNQQTSNDVYDTDSSIVSVPGIDTTLTKTAISSAITSDSDSKKVNSDTEIDTDTLTETDIDTSTDTKTKGVTDSSVEPDTSSNTEIEKEEISSVVSSKTTSSTYAQLPPQATTYHFIINEDTKKFHLPSCHKGEEILAEHRKEMDITDEKLSDAIQRMINMGYSPCGICLD